jgi:hypothetical protein
MMRWVAIVFFNDARTDYVVRGPFATYEEAEHEAEDAWKAYVADYVKAAEVSVMQAPRRNP